MREVGRELWAWLAEGAHVYVCGDAKRMAKDVERALVDIAAEHGARSTEEAVDLRRRAEEGRPLSGGRLLMNGAPARARGCPPASRRTTCPYCGVGCGVLATPDGAGRRGDRRRSRSSRQCRPAVLKGSALGETLGLEGRLLHPTIHGVAGDMAARAGRALDRVARASPQTLDAHGPDAVAIYLSGQLLTEDYYVANKLMKGFLGSANVDTNSRLCMASDGRRPPPRLRRRHRARLLRGSRRGRSDRARRLQRRVVPSGAVPAHARAGEGASAARASSSIDPRRTATAERCRPVSADRARHGHRAVLPAAWSHIADGDAFDARLHVEAHTAGFDEALARARAIAPRSRDDGGALPASPNPTSRRSSPDVRRDAARRHLLSPGRQPVGAGNRQGQRDPQCAIWRPGASASRACGPFSLTGQPNAMGGREVGGLANQLAAHMDFIPPTSIACGGSGTRRAMATRRGLRRCEMFEAIERGEIKALWVMGTNPAASVCRDADAVRAALGKARTVRRLRGQRPRRTALLDAATQCCCRRGLGREGRHGDEFGTAHFAPARRFCEPPGEARPDWWRSSEVARRLGSRFRLRLSRPGRHLSRACGAVGVRERRRARLSTSAGLAALSDENTTRSRRRNGRVRAARARAAKRFSRDGGFFTPDGTRAFRRRRGTARRRAETAALPLVLNTGRVRDQWHTMTRTGPVPRLARHCPSRSSRSIPTTRATGCVSDGGFARVTTTHGARVLRVVVTRRASGAAPCFRADPLDRRHRRRARVGALVAPSADPISGQPEAKATPAAIAPCAFSSNGFLLSRRTVVLPKDGWWARVAIPGGWGYMIASNVPPQGWRDFLTASFSCGDVIEYVDDTRGIFRAAAFDGDRLECVVFIGPDPAPGWDATLEAFHLDAVTATQRASLLSGRSRDGATDRGPVICACFGVGTKTIEAAIAGGCASPAAIGEKLRAGTNCGSCIPEIKRLIAAGGAVVSNS